MYFDILNCLGVAHEHDGRTDRQNSLKQQPAPSNIVTDRTKHCENDSVPSEILIADIYIERSLIGNQIGVQNGDITG